MTRACDPLNAEWGFWDRWADGRWEPETKDIIERYVADGTFVDIGAWIGPTAMWASPTADRVVAVEADPTALAMLHENTADLTNIDYFPVAVSDRDGETTITTAGDSMSRIGAGGVTVRCVTIETLFAEADVSSADLIKIDIEGAEREVLAQAEPFLRRFGSPILLSVHAWAPWSHDLLPGWNRTVIEPHEWLVTP